MLQFALALLLHTIQGRVTFDGTPLPGATVVLTCENGAKRVTVSDAEGRYHFDEVDGRYTIGVDMEGFAVQKTDGTTIEMKMVVVHESVSDGGDACDHPPLEDPAKFSRPSGMRLPVARGFAGAMDLAPGVH